jgi:hypothetical protein
MLKLVLEMNQTMNSHSQSIAKLEFQMEQLVHALNQIEEEELWDQSEDNSLYYMIEENASNSFHYELIQANIPLKCERIIDNEMEERKTELVLTFEPPENPIPFPVPLEMEYEPKDPFLQDLKEP